jgi:hypothetical protein
MRRLVLLCWISVLLLAVAACRREGETGQAREAASVSEEPVPQQSAVEETADTEPEETGKATEAPGRVAPATEGDEAGMKNWLLIEFARAIEAADLEWLEGNGFRVDTVMSELTVRGWLEDPAGGAAIGEDPRIAQIHAQMR